MFLVVTKLLDGHTLLAGPYKTALGARRVARKRQKTHAVSWQVIIERGTRAAGSVWVLQGQFDNSMVPTWDCEPRIGTDALPTFSYFPFGRHGEPVGPIA